jgi:hypothetical protein
VGEKKFLAVFSGPASGGSGSSSVADPDPNPDPHVFGPPLVRGMDPDPALGPDPSIIKQKRKKSLDFYYFVTSF